MSKNVDMCSCGNATAKPLYAGYIEPKDYNVNRCDDAAI